MQQTMLSIGVLKRLVTCFCLITLNSTNGQSKLASSPPKLIQQPQREITYKFMEKLSLSCQAAGTPYPDYIWLKDGVQLLNGNGVTMRQGSPSERGTIVILSMVERALEGRYQCLARNSIGTAQSDVVTVRMAVLDSFPTVREPKVHRVMIGSSFSLRCQPPTSYPPSVIHWGVVTAQQTTPRILEPTERLAFDFEGRLYFVNVQAEDTIGADATTDVGAIPDNIMYLCIVFNQFLRNTATGDDQRIVSLPQPSDVQTVELPRLLWSTPGADVMFVGQNKSIKCIFSGVPIPKITWSRLDGPFSQRIHIIDHGRELVIEKVTPGDAGRYQCTAVNPVSVSLNSSKILRLTIESAPRWRDAKPPDDVVAAEDESAELACRAYGQPRPAVSWSVNGVALSDLAPNPRRELIENDSVLRFIQVTKSDSQVVQCNVSNRHGYLFTNVVLTVLAEPPSFIQSLPALTKVAEGDNVTLTCSVVGTPKPVISWKIANKPLLPSIHDRFSVDPTGVLTITNVVVKDDNVYSCVATNKLGNDSSQGRVIVRQRTIITTQPLSQTVNKMSNVSFNCEASTDDDELIHLKLSWLYNGWALENKDRDNRVVIVTVSARRSRLLVSGVRHDDAGIYSCDASNGLDRVQSQPAQLLVKDRPDIPQNVQIVSCSPTVAEVAWKPGVDNNDPVIEYIVYYNLTLFDGERDPPVSGTVTRYRDGPRAERDQLLVRVRLVPGASYSFHVRARNGVGLSERSSLTRRQCRTPPTVPFRNPSAVCTDSEHSNQLKIVWQPMSLLERNAAGFHYRVSYYRASNISVNSTVHLVHDWRQRQLVVDSPDFGTYQAYVFYVQAVNNEGEAPTSFLEKRIGYSGQDAPLEVPTNFTVYLSSINRTSALFSWTSVDTSLNKIRGFFTGYQIVFWKSNDSQNYRVDDVIVNPWQSCPLVAIGDKLIASNDSQLTSRSTFQPRTVRALVTKLWSFAVIHAAVRVMNGARHGNHSNIVVFTTPEGVPGSVQSFHVAHRGSYHLQLQWKLPEEPNGILTGYVVGYRRAPPAMSSLSEVNITKSNVTWYKLTNLDHETTYIVYVWATTRIGRGSEAVLTERTLAVDFPDEPAIDKFHVGETFVNVSWSVNVRGRAFHNPGNRFYIEYRYTEEGTWLKTTITYNNWLMVTKLESGTMYEMRVVAITDTDHVTRSEPRGIMIGALRGLSEPVVQEVRAAGTGWFAGLMCIIVILSLALAVITTIRCRLGAIYPVREKEILHGRRQICVRDGEDEFGEYAKNGSLQCDATGGRMKPSATVVSHLKSSATVSGDMADTVDGQEIVAITDELYQHRFSEDGSSIGLYSRRHVSDQTAAVHGGTVLGPVVDSSSYRSRSYRPANTEAITFIA